MSGIIEQDEALHKNPKLCQAFKNGLYRKYNMTYDDIKTWEFCGGHKHPRATCNSDFNRYELYFYKCYPDAKMLDFIDECICGQSIWHNGYIRKDKNSTVNEIMIVGSCCIEHFINTGLKRICDSCNKPHRSHYKTEGNSCRKCRLLIIKEQKKEKCTVFPSKNRPNTYSNFIQEKKESRALAIECIREKQIELINKANTAYFYFPSGNRGIVFQDTINDMKEYKTMIKNPKTGRLECYNSFNFDFDIKAWHCKETEEFSDVINQLKKYRISDIEQFKKDRKYYKVKYEHKEQAKANGFYWDSIIGSWYEQKTNYLIK